jgi:hypothetical protein
MKLPNVIDWRTFLTDWPPGTTGPVEGVFDEVELNGWPKLHVPELQLYCVGACNGLSFTAGNVRAGGFLFAQDVG